MSNGLPMWVLYERPRDYPDCFVIRRFLITDGAMQVDAEPWVVAHTIEAARKSLPPGLGMMHRHKDDDPVIREVWL